MRIKLGCIFLTTGTVLITAPAHAETYDPHYPVCMKVVKRGGVNYNDVASHPWISAARRPQASVTHARSIRILCRSRAERVDDN